MAEDALEPPGPFAEYISSFVPSTFRHFKRKSELLSYLILCVAKMPFIPPVSIARSVSGLASKERPVGSPLVASKPKVQKEEKVSSVKERLASNLKQLGKKSQTRSRLPAAKEASAGSEITAKRRGRGPRLSTATESFTASSSGESLSKDVGRSLRNEADSKSTARPPEEAHFTLTLTPEAVVLLQRRNSERRQRSVSRNATGGGVPANATDSRRRRDNISKRQQSAAQRHSATGGRVTAKSSHEGELADISSIVKISLLNERHKYDDVEYEEEQDYGVDERVVLKCTEWLRGLENAPVTVGNGLQAV